MRIPALWARIAHLIRPGRTRRHRRADAAHTLPIPTQAVSDSGRYRLVRKRHAR